MKFSELRALYDQYCEYECVMENLPKVVGTILVLMVSGKVVKYVLTYNRLRRARNEAIRQLKASKEVWRERALSQITAEESHRIVSMKFSDLQTSLNKGQLTAKQVLRAFQRKAAVEDERLNFVAEPLDPVAAEKLAEELDAIPLSERDRLPLFGIPLSVKEHEEFVGHCSTIGCSSFLGTISEIGSPRVKILKQFGAIPFIRTNIPQAMLSFSCGNPIYGDTLNAWDTRREPGGSSGGEGAAIASGASVLGLGGDIGGSIRIPSAWSGVAGLKPTAGRVSLRNGKSSNPGQAAVKSTSGPMASSVDALIAAARVLSSEEMFVEDPSIPRQLFNEQVLNSTKPLTIGVFEVDGPIDVCNASRRAVRAAADFLAAKGHKVVPYKLRDLEKCAMGYFSHAMFSDGGSHLSSALYGDSLIPDNRTLSSLLTLPVFFKKALTFICSLTLPSYMVPPISKTVGVSSTSKYFDFLTELEEYRHRVMKDWKEQGIDAVVCPAMPVPAIPLGDSPLIKSVVAYTVLWNVLNFPAGVIPITNVTADDTAADAANYASSDMFLRIMKRGLVGSEGLPVGAQFVSLPYCEETCLRLMREVEAAADFTPLVRRS